MLITHTDTDPFNPDHPVAHAAVVRARSLAAGAGVQSAFKTVRPPELFLFEPHQPELCNFTPTLFVDITPVIEQKRAAMAEMKAQHYLQELLRAARRPARQPRAALVGQQRDPPGRGLPAGHPPGGECTVNEIYSRLAQLGSATVYEAGGRRGYVEADLIQVLPGSRAAGPARTVVCAQDDNLMVHAAMAELEPGEVLVLTMPEPRPVALIGELLATQAKVRRAAAILVDASVRDRDELVDLGLPIWARWVRVHGAVKETPGTIGDAGTRRWSDDPAGRRAGARLRRCRGDRTGTARRGAPGVAARAPTQSAIKRIKLEDGELSFDLDGLRAKLEAER